METIITPSLGSRRARFAALLLVSATPIAALAQVPGAVPIAPAPPRSTAPETAGGIVRAIEVRGAERIEPETVRSYVDLAVGGSYSRERLDTVLKALYDTDLFADVTIRDEAGVIVIEVRENPVVNRIILEGNKRLKEDKITKEVRLAPRQIFTRAKASADVGRILELYRRSGRFAAEVVPKLVQLEQNRVDVVFEIREGAKSKVRQINIIGNDKFSDGDLRGQMATKQARPYRIFSSNDTYDPDRLSYDQQKLRQYYLTNGYADFRVVSAVAELTPDRRDFIITYVVSEGERYRFGEVGIESGIRDIKPDAFKRLLSMKQGEWYDAQKVENSVNGLTEAAGLLGYAFADVRPRFDRDREKRLMNVSFVLGEVPRVYVERIDINGNTITDDKVVRREMRLAEGDAFNGFLVKRSRDRIQSLGFFQEKFEIEQKPGSGPDRVVLQANLEEKPTGELQLSAGFSSLEQFLINASIKQRNFLGIGQELRASVNYSSFATSIELGFTEPYLFNRNIALGADIFRRDYSSFNRIGEQRNTTYSQVTTGLGVRLGFPITEYWSAQLRYGLSQENVTLDRSIYFSTDPVTGIQTCDPLRAGRYLCEAIGNRLTSSIGYSLAFDNLNNRRRPSAGQRLIISQDIAGLGGDVNYIRTRFDGDKYWAIGGKGFVLNAGLEGGYIIPFAGDSIRITDRYYLGQPRFRGFDIRGVGPRVIRTLRVADLTSQAVSEDRNARTDDAIGGQAYYLGHLELEIPLGASIRELGLRPSIYADFGALWDVRRPETQSPPNIAGVAEVKDPVTGVIITPGVAPQQGFVEQFRGDSPSPRLSVGIGVNWNSPFGPFRVDLAKALLTEDGDATQLFQFNVGGQF